MGPSLSSTNLSALKNRNYRLYFIGQLISMVGTWMQSTVQAWLVYRLSHSALWLGIISFCIQLPAFAASPLAGVWADRVDRRKLLLRVEFIGMLQAFVLAALVLSHRITLFQIAVLAVILGLINAFEIITRHAIAVDLVGKHDLQSALALNSMIINLSRMIGPSIAGILILFFNEGWCFILNGLSFLAIIICLLKIEPFTRTTPLLPSLNWKQPLLEIKEGIRYTLGQTRIKNLIIISTFLSFFGFQFHVLLPVFAKTILRGDASTLGWLTAMAGAGAIVGVFGRFKPPQASDEKPLFSQTLIAIGIVLITLGQSQSLPLSMVATFGIGYFLMATFPKLNVAIQTQVEEQFRGRVVSLYTMSFMGAMPLGSFLAGFLADRIGAPLTETGFGLVVILSGVAWICIQPPKKLRSA